MQNEDILYWDHKFSRAWQLESEVSGILNYKDVFSANRAQFTAEYFWSLVRNHSLEKVTFDQACLYLAKAQAELKTIKSVGSKKEFVK